MIGDTEAKSLSEALKSNTTLTKLNLWGEDKRNNTQTIFINNNHSFPFSSNQQPTGLEKEAQNQ